MSYRDPAQSIEEPAIMTVEGMDSFLEAVDTRVKSMEWKDKHIDELMLIAHEVSGVRLKLLRLARDNW